MGMDKGLTINFNSPDYSNYGNYKKIKLFEVYMNLVRLIKTFASTLLVRRGILSSPEIHISWDIS